MQDRRPLILCYLAITMVLVVISMGAWTRLNDAGLGCPDWPGCYGQIVVPQTSEQIALAELEYVGESVDVRKGMIEMVHRYFASSLGLVIVFLALFALKNRHRKGYPVALSIGLLMLVIVQGLFGMWTVTLKLLPIVVTLHLLGGLLTLALLIQLMLRLKTNRIEGSVAEPGRLKGLLLAALFLLFIQLGLGGWTSANYAGWSCSHWLHCEADIDVELNYRDGFRLIPDIGPDYQGGVLEQPARAAIQMVHRAGALIVGLTFSVLALMLIAVPRCRPAAIALMSVLFLQVALGVLNVVFTLPLELAMAHHLGAVLLLISLLWLKYIYEQGDKEVIYG
ncbi:MAG: COX15/CtaA family protein [Amphritea sp.]